MDKNEQATTALIDKIDAIRECISIELDKGNLSSDERKFIIEQLMEIAKMYNEMDDRSKKFFDTVLGKFSLGWELF